MITRFRNIITHSREIGCTIFYFLPTSTTRKVAQSVWRTIMFNFWEKHLPPPGHDFCTILWATELRTAKLSARNTLSFELAMSSSSWRSIFLQMPREYTWTFLYLRPLDAKLSSVDEAILVCVPSVITIAIYKRDYQVTECDQHCGFHILLYSSVKHHETIAIRVL